MRYTFELGRPAKNNPLPVCFREDRDAPAIVESDPVEPVPGDTKHINVYLLTA
jgi:hypothetical protein